MSPLSRVQLNGQWDFGASNLRQICELRQECSSLRIYDHDKISWNNGVSGPVKIATIYADLCSHRIKPSGFHLCGTISILLDMLFMPG